MSASCHVLQHRQLVGGTTLRTLLTLLRCSHWWLDLHHKFCNGLYFRPYLHVNLVCVHYFHLWCLGPCWTFPSGHHNWLCSRRCLWRDLATNVPWGLKVLQRCSYAGASCCGCYVVGLLSHDVLFGRNHAWNDSFNQYLPTDVLGNDDGSRRRWLLLTITLLENYLYQRYSNLAKACSYRS